MNTRLLVLLTLLVPHVAFSQGALNPPGPPAPTMKTLDQVEARIPIGAQTPGDATAEFIIGQPGSYYLTGNIGVAKAQGIRITAAGVTLDLNGFEIRRTSGTGGDGIIIAPEADRCAVKNGSIANFAFGINCAEGLGGVTAQATSFTKLAFTGCSVRGLGAGEGARVDHCEARGNSGVGIFVRRGSAVSNCVALENNNHGIEGASGVTVTASSAASNGGSGITLSSGSTVVNSSGFGNAGGFGISTGFGGTITNCTAAQNVGDGFHVAPSSTLHASTARGNTRHGAFAEEDARISDCTLTNNGVHGILAGQRTSISGTTASFNGNASPTTGSGISGGIRMMIKDCNAIRNRADGILVGGDSVVIGNHASFNGQGGVAAGIRAAPSGSRIENNHTRDNVGTGIFAGAADVIIRNTAGNNSVADFTPNSGVNFGPIQSPGTTTNPTANHQF